MNPDVDVGVECGSQESAGHHVPRRSGGDDAAVAEEDHVVGDARRGVEVVHADDAREVVAPGEVDEEIGLDGILAELNCGGQIPQDRVLNALKLLCEEVKPRFH